MAMSRWERVKGKALRRKATLDLARTWGLCRSRGAWCPSVNCSRRLTRLLQE